MGYKRYCSDIENVENYEDAKKDNFKGWHCHHRLETHNSDGERRLVGISYKELQALGMYYHRPASELIFLTSREHNSLHHKGKLISEEHKKKVSEASKGNKRALGYRHTDETRKKIREARKGKNRSDETKKKIGEAAKGNKNVRGTLWYNNGKINIRAKECPEGFIPGRIKKALSFLTQS